MAINVEPDSRTRLTMESHYMRKSVFRDLRLTGQKQGWMHMLVFALLFEHHAIPCTPCFPCADPGFLVRGGGGGVRVNLTKKP